MSYVIRSRESGDTIEAAATLDEAKKIVESYEAEDRKDGSFTPDFYEICEQNPTDEVADAIRARLAERGITQKQLAERLEIHPVSLSAMLRGGNMKVETLAKFAAAIGCSVADFFGEPVHRCPHCGKPIAVTLQ
jgi:DNA-binding Xre family transcriptional regulator